MLSTAEWHSRTNFILELKKSWRKLTTVIGMFTLITNNESSIEMHFFTSAPAFGRIIYLNIEQMEYRCISSHQLQPLVAKFT